MARVGVILSGCGFKDGAEIHEATLTLLALDEAGAAIACLAPNMPQASVVNHRTGAAGGEKRNVLAESARIARGRVQDLADVGPDDFDAVVLPGGFGAALNLCDFAIKGAGCGIHPEVERLLIGMHAAGKPIGAWCIAPAVVARALANRGVQLTIGTDPETAHALEMLGAKHVSTPVDGVVVDEANRVVSTPAYMLAASIKEIRAGIEKAVGEVLRLARTRR